MLDVLMATATLIAIISIFFLCYLTHTLNQQLKNNDEVINRLQNIINQYKMSEENEEILNTMKRTTLFYTQYQ